MVLWGSEEQCFSVMDCYGKLPMLESTLSDKKEAIIQLLPWP